MSSDVKLISFFLPQFHPIPENDKWWGPGFTEWTNVTKANSLFPGHVQPRLPAELGFYDLRIPEVREKQAELAREYSIHGFCYYHYWFGPGKRLLKRPIDEMLASDKPDFPFCLCWANENWTRRWDGDESEVLMEQTYTDEVASDFVESLLPAFRDRRYIRIDDKPLLLVYDIRQFGDLRRSTALWRKHAREAGFEDLYLVRCNTFCQFGRESDPLSQGFDSCVEFPPHGLNADPLDLGQKDLSKAGPTVLDYESMMFASINRPDSNLKLLRGVTTSWDNTPRKPQNPTIYFGSSPSLYEQWLAEMVEWTRKHHRPDERLIFINAWNEWAEGAILEPDRFFGRQYLEATRRALDPQQPVSYIPSDFTGVTMQRGTHAIDETGQLTYNGIALARTDKIVGKVEHVSSQSDAMVVDGWVVDESTPFVPLQLLAFDGLEPAGIARTSMYRTDIADDLGMRGLRSGFQLRTHRKVSEWENLSVYAINADRKYTALPLK